MAKKIPVVELFGPTMQGEGALIGQSSHFLRTGGCSRKCVQCDSLHAVLPELFRETADYLYPDQIVERISRLPKAKWLTFSGGDPLMWDMQLVIEALRTRTQGKMNFAVETQGDLWRPWLHQLNHITVSPKGIGMDPEKPTNWDMLKKYATELHHKMCFKVVVFRPEDIEFLEKIRKTFPSIPLYASVGTNIEGYNKGELDDLSLRLDILNRYRWVVDEIYARDWGHTVTILPQTHVLIWGTKKGV